MPSGCWEYYPPVFQTLRCGWDYWHFPLGSLTSGTLLHSSHWMSCGRINSKGSNVGYRYNVGKAHVQRRNVSSCKSPANTTRLSQPSTAGSLLPHTSLDPVGPVPPFLNVRLQPLFATSHTRTGHRLVKRLVVVCVVGPGITLAGSRKSLIFKRGVAWDFRANVDQRSVLAEVGKQSLASRIVTVAQLGN